MSNDPSPSKVMLKDVRFSYAHVFEPKAVGTNTEKKYSVSILIPKGNAANKKAIDAACDHLIAEVKLKNKGKLPPNFKMIVRDGDVDRPDDDAYAGHWFVNATSKAKPGLVNRLREPIIEQDHFKSGDYGHADINFYTYDTNGSRGIACGLNNIMKTKDGDALSGRASAQQAFADIEFEDDPLLS